MGSLQQAQIIREHYYNNFANSIRAQATKKMYIFYFKKYSEYVKDNIIRESTKDIETQVIDYLLSLKSNNLSQSAINFNLSAIIHFYTMNDILLNRKKISKFVNTDHRRRFKNTGYTSEQIHKLLDISDERLKAIILIYASTGIRLAALPLLQVKDLTEVSLPEEDEKLYQITVYQGYKEEYMTFCTPECYKAIISYFSYRQRSGEVMKPNSPLIREQFDLQDSFKVKNGAKAIDIKTISKIVRQKAVQSGIREIQYVGTGEGNMAAAGKVRKDVPLMHGFRKFFNTALMNADVSLSFKELLMGHSIRLDDVYYHKDSQKSRDKLLSEYCKAIDALTINEENRLRRKVEQLTVEKSQMDRLQKEVDKIKQLIKPR
jgi:integrase